MVEWDVGKGSRKKVTIRFTVPEDIRDRLERVCRNKAFGYKPYVLRKALARVLAEEEEKLRKQEQPDEFGELG